MEPIHIHKHEFKGANLVYSIILNVVITAAQFVGGLVSGSLALLSDALHNFTDVLSLIFTFIARRLSRRKASLNQTFGYKRAEILAAFINASTLIIIAIYLALQAVFRFFHPEPIESELVIWLSILGIIANGFSVLLLRSDAKKSLNMKSAYLHLFTDMLASVAVLIGGLLMKFFAWFWVDSVMTLAISIYLIIVAIKLLRDSTQMLMLFTPSHINIKQIVREVHKIEGVNKLHHIHVWHLNDEELHLEAHLDCKSDIKLSEFNIILSEVEQLLYRQFNINHTNIQPEYSKEDPKDYIVQD